MPPGTFGALLRQLRDNAGLTQEELAAAAGLSVRSVSDLERGVTLTARKETARLLADALGLAGTARAEFDATARGRSPATVPSAPDTPSVPDAVEVTAGTRTLPRDIASFTGREAELHRLTGTVLEEGSRGGRDQVEAFINDLALRAATDRDGLICQLNSYSKSKEVAL